MVKFQKAKKNLSLASTEAIASKKRLYHFGFFSSFIYVFKIWYLASKLKKSNFYKLFFNIAGFFYLQMRCGWRQDLAKIFNFYSKKIKLYIILESWGGTEDEGGGQIFDLYFLHCLDKRWRQKKHTVIKDIVQILAMEVKHI